MCVLVTPITCLVYHVWVPFLQAEAEVKAVKVELERAQEAHQGTKQKLGLLEKEAKSSNLMSMELEDYQRSIQSLEGELALKGQQLEQALKETHLHHETLQNSRKDAGTFLHTLFPCAWPLTKLLISVHCATVSRLSYCFLRIFDTLAFPLIRVADSAACSERGDSDQVEAACDEEQERACGGEEERGGAVGNHCCLTGAAGGREARLRAGQGPSVSSHCQNTVHEAAGMSFATVQCKVYTVLAIRIASNETHDWAD
jgi:hypothetical protein